jgi:hypothetical protein
MLSVRYQFHWAAFDGLSRLEERFDRSGEFRPILDQLRGAHDEHVHLGPTDDKAEVRVRHTTMIAVVPDADTGHALVGDYLVDGETPTPAHGPAARAPSRRLARKGSLRNRVVHCMF